MKTTVLGYPRIGEKRELKKVLEAYWSGKISPDELLKTGKRIRKNNWELQKNAGIDWISSNDFSYYDQVLDTTLLFGAIPKRYQYLVNKKSHIDLLFAMARGYQDIENDIVAMEMTKWFDTNYHYIVPEFTKNQEFKIFYNKILKEYLEAKELGIETKPVLLGPISYLLLGKEKEEGFESIDLIDKLLPVYIQLIQSLVNNGVQYLQIDEPFLCLNLTPKQKQAYLNCYQKINQTFPNLHIFLATYFEGLNDNLNLVINLPIQTLHIDLVYGKSTLDNLLNTNFKNTNINLSLGLVNGRNIWKNNFTESLEIIQKATNVIGSNRIWVSSSCSLLHSPCDLNLEKTQKGLPLFLFPWMAFAKQKLEEIVVLKELICNENKDKNIELWQKNTADLLSRKNSEMIHDEWVKQRIENLSTKDCERLSGFKTRQAIQRNKFKLPLFPTTTIGSFPQTTEIRKLRANFKNGKINEESYKKQIAKLTEEVIKWQEEIGIDVLVHGEYERNDMVEYFGENLNGFAFTYNGWVQSYGSRCVKPPIIYGDVKRIKDLSVEWSKFAQSKTQKIVKGMLTGPVTILQWSFERDDQDKSITCKQIALAIRDEVSALEAAGIQIIQIDEPAFREGLPLRKENWKIYLNWAVEAFKISSCSVKDETQIHTHMCYSEFNDIIENISDLDADVITIETSRSEMELLDAFVNFKYPNEIGPGVYDIHSPRVPAVNEMVYLLQKAKQVLPAENIWVNPDCGLKTRNWYETKLALINMVEAAKKLREN